jgi:large subunit ribosomal protein L21
MYAVIKTGGKQYAVERGDRLFIERLDVDPGAKIEFDRVLYLNADDAVRVGTPYLDAVRVLATVVENGKAKKVVTFKYKAKKDYRKKRGHRQPYTLVEIDAISVDGEIVSGASAADAETERTPAEEAVVAEKPETAEDAAEKTETGTEAPLDAADAAEKSETDETAFATKKPKRAIKPKTENSEADATETPAEKPKRAAKPKTDAGAVSAEKPKRTAKPKAEKPETEDAETEKPVAKKTENPKLEGADAVSAAPEEDKSTKG